MRNFSILFFLAVPFSFIYAGFDRLITDFLWSSFYEINFSPQDITFGFGFRILFFLLLVSLSAFACGRLPLRWTLERASQFLLLIAIILLPLSELYYGLIEIPRRHSLVTEIFPSWARTAQDQGCIIIFLISVSQLLFASLYRVYQKEKFKGFFFRSVLSIALALAGFAFVSGMPAYYTFLAGRYFEKQALPNYAMSCYSRTLDWAHAESLKSYLQFRVGLLHRKKGDIIAAREAFTRVLLKYNQNEEIRDQADNFHQILCDTISSDGARVVIPGVETRTEYKAAYCVPNSLGLVLNYWGDKVGAREIGASFTRLNEGSFLTDAAFYAESRGYKHYALPLCTRSDIMQLINNNIPVLAYIPGHVLAVLGYDKLLKTYITYDVATTEIWDETSWTKFELDWGRTYNIMAVVIPKEQEAVLKTIFGTRYKERSEDYLQYMSFLLSNSFLSHSLSNLERASGKGLFFADWDYAYYAKRNPEPLVSDTVIHDYLMRKKTGNNAVLLYLHSLLLSNAHQKAVMFLEAYQKRQSLSSELTASLAGFYYQSGRRDDARDLLVSYNDFQNLNTYSLEFMLRSPSVIKTPHLALQLSVRILSGKAWELINGHSAKLAFEIWKQYSTLYKHNVNESLEFVFRYLKNWNSMDASAIDAFETFYQQKRFDSDNEKERKIWEDRLNTYKANLVTETGMDY
ncbi:MAG: hypothetical protein HQK83_11405 [Fibrobacteria bacterium]|nr:hypothetical protein [Fibrobacteria bacterium]